MINHRELQRCLFRAQMDTVFAQSLHAGEAEARAKTNLSDAELALFQQASLAGITADPGHTRRLQMLGNATLEYRLSLAAAHDPRGTIEGFTVSTEFHDAVQQDASLAVAAGHYLHRCFAGQFWARTLCELELALARSRRAAKQNSPPCGAWQTANSAQMIELPAGSLEFAGKLRIAIDQESALPKPPKRTEERESVLCFSLASQARWKLAQAHSELISPAIAHLFEFLSQPKNKKQIGEFAHSLGADLADLLPVLNDFQSEGALVWGGAH